MVQPDEWGDTMRNTQIPRLKSFALAFILPGLAGLMLASTISTYYMNALPKFPDPQSLHMIPRNVDGYTVYQTENEDRMLSLVENGSGGLFLIGLVMGLVYMQKWGITRAIQHEDDEFVPEEG